MGVPHTSASFADLVDKRVTKIFYETYDELPDVLPQLFLHSILQFAGPSIG